MKIQYRAGDLSRMAYSLWVALGLLSWTGCGSESAPVTAETSKYEVAEEPAAPAGSAAAPSAAPASQPATREPSGAATETPFTPPASPAASTAGAPVKPSAIPPVVANETPGANATSQELLEHIQKLQKHDPRAATREETITNLTRSQREIVTAADRILSSKEHESAFVKAAEAKIQSLTLLSQIQPESQTELKAFIAELKGSSNPQFGRLAERMDVAQLMDAVANGDNVDIPKLVERFKRLFNEEKKDASLFGLSQQVIEVFMRAGHTEEAADVMKLLAETFAGNPNAELATASKMLSEQLAIIEIKLDAKVTAVLEEKPKAHEEFLAALDKLFTGRELGAMTLQYLSQVTHLIESQSLDLADKMFTKMVAAFEKQSTPEVAKAVKDMAANFGKRKAIVGKPFVVEGVTLGGEPFDWSKLEGKVVLVDFWATWCAPCLREIPNIKDNYDKYHDQGFEVVGVNIDEEPENLQRFFSRQQLPWPTVLSPDPQKVGFEHPLMVKCGVEGIPFLVLVDRDGKAIALNLRGEALGKKLATMFGSPAAPAAGSTTPGNSLRTPAPTKTEAKSGG